MMSIHRNLAVLLLFLHSHLYTHAASTSSPVTHPPFKYITINSNNEYEDEEEFDKHSSPPEVVYPARTTLLRQKPQFCQYDPCLENQEPCEDLNERTGCLCPGRSGADVPPKEPRIDTLLPISEGEHKGKIEVQWCAPSSVVTRYRVVVQGNEEGALEFQATARRTLVGSLEPGTMVCVEAVNKAGGSVPSEFSCKRYERPESSDHNLLLGVIGGGVIFLLILIITAVILWKYQMYKRAKRNSTDGLGNPSYSTEGTL
ncbi:LRRN4 C-terminal-like protein [Larimichthys crocea]|uniref:LRRN4 C-terminal-like protein n=1 Tax=Larimichthys crocea TaxID=215358 RepID=UPI0009016BA3|nr:LRRN4 C-terminal-like protein [Larimichthys crocea]XP_019109026.1 LRRN4 C-terminal-like protein [Larimichthys crocea]